MKAAGAPLGRRGPVLPEGHGQWAWAARWLVLAAVAVVTAGVSGQARASEPGFVAYAQPSAEAEALAQRSGFSCDLQLGFGLASVTYEEGSHPVADFSALALGAEMRFGGFLDPHIVIGGEVAFNGGSGVGSIQVRDPSFFASSGYPSGTTYGSFSPFGVFVELYPWEKEGVFFGAAAGVGVMQMSTVEGSKGGVMARYALELGYELGRTGKHGPAIYLRHERWEGSEPPLSDDHPNGLVSRELLVGLRWSFWTPVWHTARELSLGASEAHGADGQDGRAEQRGGQR